MLGNMALRLAVRIHLYYINRALLPCVIPEYMVTKLQNFKLPHVAAAFSIHIN